jgi:2-polyprenyl-3-methyl-5-hydroxy-6-metoxy-1,4-benzoquinol methylase
MLEDTRNQDKKNHWETVYETKPESEVSWHQDNPAPSLNLIRNAAVPRSSVIDIGGGSSVLAGRLVALGFEHVAVLDISKAALERAKERVGTAADQIRWIVADVTSVQELGQFDVWHDRAVFHFLTEPDDREKYVELATRTVPVGGRLIIGTFALDGPEKCSGLLVERYDSTKLAVTLGQAFLLRHQEQETHLTPWGKPQQFTYAVFERISVTVVRTFQLL